MSKVSLVKNKNSYRGVQESLELIESDLKDKIKDLNQIVIKVNFVTTEVELAGTPVEAVAAFIDFVKPFYKGKTIIAEEPTFGNVAEAFEEYGYRKLANAEPQVELVDSSKAKAKLVRVGMQLFPLSRIYTDLPFVVSITRAKTHDAVVVTLAIKNLLVGAIKHTKAHNRFRIHLGKKIHSIMTGIAKYTYPDLAIIDGTLGMEGDGPADGTPINAGWVVSSLDALAADSLATHLMGFDIADVGYLNLLRDKKFGKLYPKDKIEIVGESPEDLVTPFKPHRTFERQRNWR